MIFLLLLLIPAYTHTEEQENSQTSINNQQVSRAFSDPLNALNFTMFFVEMATEIERRYQSNELYLNVDTMTPEERIFFSFIDKPYESATGFATNHDMLKDMFHRTAFAYEYKCLYNKTKTLNQNIETHFPTPAQFKRAIAIEYVDIPSNQKRLLNLPKAYFPTSAKIHIKSFVHKMSPEDATAFIYSLKSTAYMQFNETYREAALGCIAKIVERNQ